MFESFLITSRETLEAALVIGLVLSFLARTGQDGYKKWVWYGLTAGIAMSLIFAFLFLKIAGGFEGYAEEVFEGITMFVAAGLLTTMIFWMLRQKKSVRQSLENKVTHKMDKAGTWGLFTLVLFSILREGTETVIFLNAVRYSSGINGVTGFLGILFSIGIAYAFFAGSKKISLQTFFSISSILLILFAAGLVAHGVHEFEEAGILHGIVSPIWDINPPLLPDGGYPVLHEKGLLGSLFTGLFGYNWNPSLLEVSTYVIYLLILLFTYRRLNRKIST